MKRVIVSCLALLCAAPVAASTICAEDDVIAIVLDPTIRFTSSSRNNDLMEWGATLPYGTLWGVAACIDVPGLAQGRIGPENLTDSNGEIVVGGEKTGKYCWCQMRHPARSRWVFHSVVYNCDTACIGWCADSFKGGSVAYALFDSVGN